MAQDLPTGGNVVAGQAQITSPSTSQMTINQSTNNAVINWDSFNVGSGAQVQFNQPSTSSATLNRVNGSTGSEIHGQITANGSVFVVNPNGIFIGADGNIQTGGGFVASTLDISNDDFQNGRLRFEGNGQSAKVENAGTITVGRGGYAALLGGHVDNSGTISVPMGRVAFGSGERITLDLSGDGFLQVAVPTDAISEEGQALIEHSGSVAAEGGMIEMKAATAREAVRQAVNLSGVAEATSVQQRGGTIFLGGGAGGQVQVTGRVSARAEVVTAVETSIRPQARGGDITVTGVDIALTGAEIDASGADGGGRIRIGGDFAGAGDLQRAETVVVDAATTITSDALDAGDGGRIAVWSDIRTDFAGTISAKGGSAGGDGGFVEVSSAQTLNYTGRTNTTAALGETGTLLLDPTDIIIDTLAEEEALEADLATTNVTLNTASAGADDGNIIISRDIDWTNQTSLILIADNDIVLNGALNGVNGTLSLSAAGDIIANDAVNVDLFIQRSGNWQQVGTLPVFFARNFIVQSGEFLRAAGGTGDAASPFEIVDIFGLQGIGSSDRMLSSNFVLGTDIDASGTRNWSRIDDDDGLVVRGFDPIGDNSNVFVGTLDGDLHSISNLFIDNSVTGTVRNGAMIEFSSGTISSLILQNVDVTSQRAAGLVTFNDGRIDAVEVTGQVIGSVQVGGITLQNRSVLSNSIASVDVSFVSDRTVGDLSVGGLAAQNNGTISRSHSTGNVSVDWDLSGGTLRMDAGAFVGNNAGTISDSYALGDVSVNAMGTGPTIPNEINAGGFVGDQRSGTISRSYSVGAVAVSDTTGAVVAIGGFAGNGTGDASNFWDVNTSGLTTSAFGTGLTTAQFQDTDTFLRLAEAEGWVFTGSGATWAPGTEGQYARLYATSPVLFIAPVDIEVVYGETDGTAASGAITGGPDLYAFADPSATPFDGDTEVSGLTFEDTNVGETTYGFDVEATVTDDAGQVYDIVSGVGNAEITPRPLTITANDVDKTYGDNFDFGLGDITVEIDNGVDASGLIEGDSVDAVTLTSAGADAGAGVADSPYVVTASNASGDGLGNYEITFVDGTLTVTPLAVSVTGSDMVVAFEQTVLFDDDFVLSTELIGTDQIETILLSGPSELRDAILAGETITLASDEVTGSGSENYEVTVEGATFTIADPLPQPDPDPVPIPDLVPVTIITLPNPPDTLGDLDLSPAAAASSGGDGAATGGAVADALEGQAQAQVAANGLVTVAEACAGGEDVETVLACLSDALDAFGTELDTILLQLPPELGDVARIIEDARDGVEAARRRAQARLATATTEAERAQIRNEALIEARASIDIAANRLRQRVALVRAQDPDLAAVQQATISVVATAVETVGVELARATDL
ncbi:filamentous hemagglutinin N-terminal domain-containing protein [Cognatiyoonia sp. IB215182]|uniref:two-partner secretion domain-containing protein n=1 Tax=Cognatiyoonia sp. IB215182 TaxID=3097353 RepID=UPI002A23EA70|nr:filamentous hemagglutinin N-terminal domain-containing protein [Cognatiyoonia sp. IB215182]